MTQRSQIVMITGASVASDGATTVAFAWRDANSRAA
jgi:hypothetical protein